MISIVFGFFWDTLYNSYTPEKLVTSRVVPIAISDHYLILTMRKLNIHLNQIRNKKIEIRNFKHFNAENFINDLQDQMWDLCDRDFSVDKKWVTWKTLFQNQKRKKQVQCTLAY